MTQYTYAQVNLHTGETSILNFNGLNERDYVQTLNRWNNMCPGVWHYFDLTTESKPAKLSN
jgi:hypothetical protein